MKINIYSEIHICHAAWVLICDYKAEIKTKQAKNHTHNQKGSILHALGTAPDVQNSKFSVYAVEQITQMSMTWWHFILYQEVPPLRWNQALLTASPSNFRQYSVHRVFAEKPEVKPPELQGCQLTQKHCSTGLVSAQQRFWFAWLLQQSMREGGRSWAMNER